MSPFKLKNSTTMMSKGLSAPRRYFHWSNKPETLQRKEKQLMNGKVKTILFNIIFLVVEKTLQQWLGIVVAIAIDVWYCSLCRSIPLHFTLCVWHYSFWHGIALFVPHCFLCCCFSRKATECHCYHGHCHMPCKVVLFFAPSMQQVA